MAKKELVTLCVLVDTGTLSWWVAALRDSGDVRPLLRSEPGDLDRYRGLSSDEQTSFLRHRFCNILQRGTDRLWGYQMKAQTFAFILDNDLPHAAAELTVRTADHLVQWMSQPPVIFVRIPVTADPAPRVAIAGEVTESQLSHLTSAAASMRQLQHNSSDWETVPGSPKS